MKDYLQLDISKYQVNGIIHIGAAEGTIGNDYYKLGVNKVLWFEDNHANYNKLYENTRNLKMVQQYAFDDLTKTEFKNWWRNNISWCDIETYDMVSINFENNQKTALEGFKDLLRTVNIIYFFNGFESGLEEWLKANQFKLVEYITSTNINSKNEFSHCYFERIK